MKILIISSTNEKEEYIIPNCEDIIKTTHFKFYIHQQVLQKIQITSQVFFKRINFFLMDYWGLKEPFVYIYSIFSSLFFTSSQLADSDTRDSTTSLGRQSVIKNWISILI